MTRSSPALDDLDYRIVRLLTEEPHLTNKALAARVGVPESTCAYRVRRLYDSKVVAPPRLELDHALLGYGLRAIITVYMSSHSREAVDRFTAAMVGTPNVVEVTHLTGRSDFMITVAVADREQLRNFVLDHVTTHPAVRGTETQVVFDVQRGTWIPTRPDAHE